MSKKHSTITKEEIVKKFIELNKKQPSWEDKTFGQMSKEENNEYMRTRSRIVTERKNENKVPQEAKVSEPLEEERQEPVLKQEKPFSDEEKLQLTNYTTDKISKDVLPETDEEAKEAREEKFITDYIKHHKIPNQERLNYAIEHDEKFRIFLEITGRINNLYTGSHIGFIEKQKVKIEKQLLKEAKKDKWKLAKKLKKRKKDKKKIKKISNDFDDSKKDLDLDAYRNKKLEKQGYIMCMYLRKNSQAHLRYVQMDEVGQIKIDGYVYHERDAMYRFGKKNDPILIIIEGSLIPITKELLKENLGFETAEAQKLVIKGIEQAEVVKAGGIDEDARKPLTPPKWMIGIGIAIMIGIYAYMGGFS